MKFSNGYWMKRDGVTVFSPKEVRDIKITEKSVILYVAPWNVVQRGMTLTGPLFTMTFTSPQPGIMTFKNEHFIGGVQNKAQFEINDAQCALETTKSDNLITIKSGAMKAEITLDSFNVIFSYNGRYLTSTGNRKLGYAQTPDGNYMLEQLDMSVGERVYGLGERFTPFVKNGQNVDIWNEDGGTASEQAYKNIPFYMSSNNYGLFVDNTGKVSFEIASEVVSRIQFSVPGEGLKYHIIGGDTRKDILGAYTNLTGRPALPPAWSMGLWLTTSFTTDYDEKTVTSFVDGMAERNIPLHVFHYDCFWMKEYEWCNFQWDEAMFPDVDGMLKRLKGKGLKICVWINSYIGQKSPLFKEGAEKGYLLKTKDGGTWQWDKWQPGMGLVDFTNPDACKWYQEKLKVLLDQGVDCFKTDFGERIPFDDSIQYFDGTDAVSMHNYYTHLYNKTVFDLLVRERGEGEACLFARSATAGGQQYPVHWGGDCNSDYLSMAESLRGGLSLTLSGFGFWSHDISGFEATATPDVYKRWAAFGLLSTHSRLHGSGSYRVPWLFDEESVDVLRYFTNLKCRLMPYLFKTAVKTHKTGLPAMRAMLLDFEDDRTCLDLDTQYMLGDSIMVAPVFREDKIVTYYLPKGTWTHLLTGETHEGGWYTEEYDYFSLPLFVKENSFVALGGNDQLAEYDYAEGLDLKLYSLQDGETAETELFYKDGTDLLKASASRKGNNITITFNGVCPDATLVGIDNAAVSGADATKTEDGTKLTNTTAKIEITL